MPHARSILEWAWHYLVSRIFGTPFTPPSSRTLLPPNVDENNQIPFKLGTIAGTWNISMIDTVCQNNREVVHSGTTAAPDTASRTEIDQQMRADLGRTKKHSYGRVSCSHYPSRTDREGLSTCLATSFSKRAILRTLLSAFISKLLKHTSFGSEGEPHKVKGSVRD